MQELYDKKVLHRLAGVSPRAIIVQDVPQLNGAARSNGVIVQSAWEPTERSQETDDEENARKPAPTTKKRPREVIDVDADDEEGRYGIPRHTRRKISEVTDVEVETIFTTDEGSEGDEIIVVESTEEGGSLAEEEAEYEHVEEKGIEEKPGGQVRINRKREFWAAKAGTSSAGLGT